MKFTNTRITALLAVLLLGWSALAQNKTDREIDIHENVKLAVMTIPSDIPEDMREQFRLFLPILEEVLKETTTDQSTDCALTVRVSAGFKEIGSAKTRRPTAVITAFRRSSRQEYIGTFILYSYVSEGLVNKEETEQFLTRQILEPAACHADE
jgi:hypothetical protein